MARILQPLGRIPLPLCLLSSILVVSLKSCPKVWKVALVALSCLRLLYQNPLKAKGAPPQAAQGSSPPPLQIYPPSICHSKDALLFVKFLGAESYRRAKENFEFYISKGATLEEIEFNDENQVIYYRDKNLVLFKGYPIKLAHKPIVFKESSEYEAAKSTLWDPKDPREDIIFDDDNKKIEFSCNGNPEFFFSRTRFDYMIPLRNQLVENKWLFFNEEGLVELLPEGVRKITPPRLFNHLKKSVSLLQADIAKDVATVIKKDFSTRRSTWELSGALCRLQYLIYFEDKQVDIATHRSLNCSITFGKICCDLETFLNTYVILFDFLLSCPEALYDKLWAASGREEGTSLQEFRDKMPNWEAHGIDSRNGGLKNMANLILEGRLRDGIYSGPIGTSKAYDGSFFSGCHGPYFIFLCYKDPKEHLAYFVPNSEDKETLLEIFHYGLEAGKLIQSEFDWIKSRLFTYNETDQFLALGIR